MKRHPALEQLSRDHHHALVVAQRLKRAEDPDSAEPARNTFLDYWRTAGAEHFRQEEDILLPTFAHHADPDQPVVARVLIEHVQIRALAEEIAAAAPRLDVLHRAGELLERHVRREERELFPLLEAAVPDAELRRLAERLEG